LQRSQTRRKNAVSGGEKLMADRRLLFGFVCVLLLATPQALAKDEGKVEGTFFLKKEGCDRTKPGDCPINLELSGTVAKTLYEAMVGAAKADACTEGQVKTDPSGMRCYKLPGGKFECDFGYNFKSSRMTASNVSC
jgi:hypothetical protein